LFWPRCARHGRRVPRRRRGGGHHPTNLPIRTAGNLTLTLVNKVHDPLHSRALVLDDGATQFVIAVVDSCMISREDLDEAKSAATHVTGIPVENMLIAATHTHTAPAVYGCHGNDAEPAYRAWVIPRITESIVQAWRNLRTARVGWGKSDLPTFVHCRRWVMQPARPFIRIPRSRDSP